MFCKDRVRYYLGALLTSKITPTILNMLNPTLTYNIENVASIPVVFDEEKKDPIDNLALDCVSLARADWDSFETSWDFKRHPLIPLPWRGAPDRGRGGSGSPISTEESENNRSPSGGGQEVPGGRSDHPVAARHPSTGGEFSPP